MRAILASLLLSIPLLMPTADADAREWGRRNHTITVEVHGVLTVGFKCRERFGWRPFCSYGSGYEHAKRRPAGAGGKPPAAVVFKYDQATVDKLHGRIDELLKERDEALRKAADAKIDAEKAKAEADAAKKKAELDSAAAEAKSKEAEAKIKSAADVMDAAGQASVRANK